VGARLNDRHDVVPLARMPRWAKLLIAVAVVVVVVVVARLVAPPPVAPTWLDSWIQVSGWLYLAIVLRLLVGWFVRTVKRRRAQDRRTDNGR
jgi:protein-S-isoprenylcysteine O-methyltransferase Ste14